MIIPSQTFFTIQKPKREETILERIARKYGEPEYSSFPNHPLSYNNVKEEFFNKSVFNPRTGLQRPLGKITSTKTGKKSLYKRKSRSRKRKSRSRK